MESVDISAMTSVPTGSNDDEVSPPDFNEEWPLLGPPRLSRGGRSPGASDFPDVGEMSIPHVSPMTAHVILSTMRLM